MYGMSSYGRAEFCSERGKNSDDAVFEDLDTLGLYPKPALFGRTRWWLGTSSDIGLENWGDIGCGGLFGGSETGLIGIWKYLVVFGKSIVDTEATDFVCVGGR